MVSSCDKQLCSSAGHVQKSKKSGFCMARHYLSKYGNLCNSSQKIQQYPLLLNVVDGVCIHLGQDVILFMHFSHHQ